MAINRTSDERDNHLIAQPPNLVPWLQDTTNQAVWARWQIAYRDVLILDSFNRPVARDNLTSHDLGNPLHYDALKRAFLQLAVALDTDRDGLADDWEWGWFGSLDPAPQGDDDGDTFDNLTEFTFGTSPRNPEDFPKPQPTLVQPAGRPSLRVTTRRFSGAGVVILAETSPDLVTWTGSPTEIFQVGTPRNLFDGTGAMEVRYQLTAKAGALPAGFIRLRAAPTSPGN